MSIYRKSDPYRWSEPQSNAYASRAPVPLRAPTQMSVGQEERKRLRKASPANMPLPRTLTWVASLPPNVQPTALLRQYARIANLVAAAWGAPKPFDAYMESLLNDTRGNRRGLPSEVLDELVTLQRYHHDTIREDDAPWETVSKRG
ncbi:MAG: hypothetical protein M3R31_12025 [Pseudomonadota bacterium]|nr:hypothetical protein [Pseudomonadota bacterium]